MVCLVAASGSPSASGRTSKHYVYDLAGHRFEIELPSQFKQIGGVSSKSKGIYVFTSGSTESVDLFVRSGDPRAFAFVTQPDKGSTKLVARFSQAGYEVKVTTWRVDPKALRKVYTPPPQSNATEPYVRANATIVSPTRNDLVVVINYRGELSVTKAGRLVDSASRRFVDLNAGAKI